MKRVFKKIILLFFVLFFTSSEASESFNLLRACLNLYRNTVGITSEEISLDHDIKVSSGLIPVLEEVNSNLKQSRNIKRKSLERVYVIQLSKIKDLNEKIWHFTGTESFLESIFLTLQIFFNDHPELGKIIGQNYKNHYILSTLKLNEFNKLVFSKIITELVVRIGELQTNLPSEFLKQNPNWDWKKWLTQNFFISYGTNEKIATWRANIIKNKFKLKSNWMETSTLLRSEIYTLIGEDSSKWTEFLNFINEIYYRENESLRSDYEAWIIKNGLQDNKTKLIEYAQILTITQFIPTENLAKEIWPLQRRKFLSQAQNDAQITFVTDVKRLGLISLKLRDRWVANGAKLAEFDFYNNQVEQIVSIMMKDIEQSLKTHFGADIGIHMYYSGDDGVWSISNFNLKRVDDFAKFLENISFVSVKKLIEEDPKMSLDTIDISVYVSDPVIVGEPPSSHLGESIIKARKNLIKKKGKL